MVSKRYAVWRAWDGPGYRLYEIDGPEGHIGCQVHGEINGRVFRTIREARAHCLAKYGVYPKYDPKA